MELIFNFCGEFRRGPESPVSQIHSHHLYVGAPGIFSDLLRSVQMLKREWGAESDGKLPNQFIPTKTVTLIPEFAVEDLPLDRTAALVPEFAMKDLLLDRMLDDDDDDDIGQNNNVNMNFRIKYIHITLGQTTVVKESMKRTS